jgi:hypothetical protein
MAARHVRSASWAGNIEASQSNHANFIVQFLLKPQPVALARCMQLAKPAANHERIRPGRQVSAWQAGTAVRMEMDSRPE